MELGQIEVAEVGLGVGLGQIEVELASKAGASPAELRLGKIQVAELEVAHLSEKSSRRQYKIFRSKSEMESYIHEISPGY